jgi:effector-binding domain-containing protein
MMGMQEFKLKDMPQRKIFYMACRGPWRQLPEMLAKLSQYTAQADVKIIGPPGAFYHNTPQEVNVHDLEWEVFYPIEPDTPESINERTGFGVKFIEAMRVATTVHEGSYRNTASSYKRLHGWIGTQGLKTCGAAEEVYLTGINKTIEGQRTEICLPVCTA